MDSFISVCRICLNASNDYIDFQSRFESRDEAENFANDMNYLQCVRLCTNLPIEADDAGPQCLCSDCEVELHVVYKFLQKAQNSHAILIENWQKNDCNKESIEHTEILIEKCNEAENKDLCDNLVEAHFDSEYDELSNDCSELVSPVEDDEIFDLSDTNNIAEEEKEVFTKEGEGYALFQIECIPEDTKNSQNNTRTFIPKKYKCHICNRCYTTERLLKVHLYYHKRRNLGSKPYSCKICGESFPFQRYLTQHMIEHQDCRETHKCPYCDKEYVTKTALISHKRIHQEALICTECGKQLNGSYEFTVHLRFHKREKERRMINCEICGKEYSSSRYLAQHMTVHLKDRKTYKCDYCNKAYVSKAALENHQRLHESQTTECNECGKQFALNCELKLHTCFHEREHPFKCKSCEKVFTTKNHLKTHVRQHRGITLECKDCGKLFKTAKALNEHSCYSHGEMSYSYEYCEKPYSSKHKYESHFENKHSSEGSEIDLSQNEVTQQP